VEWAMARGESSNNLESNVAIQVIESTLSAAADKLCNNPERKKQIKILGLNLGIAAADIITFSQVDILASSLAIAFGSTIIFLSAVGVIYGNYRLFAEPERSIPTPPTWDDLIIQLDQHRGIKTFEEDIDLAIDQIARLKRKNKKIRDLLEQKFDGSEITIEKFLAGVAELKNAFYMNIQIILNKLDTFDGLDKIGPGNFSRQISEDKKEVFDKYVTSIKSATEYNERILLMLDKMLLEISNMDCLDSIQWDKMIEEFDILIKQITEYRN
jgi:hypothetical protein